jgi:hypothetical protein
VFLVCWLPLVPSATAACCRSTTVLARRFPRRAGDRPDRRALLAEACGAR